MTFFSNLARIIANVAMPTRINLLGGSMLSLEGPHNLNYPDVRHLLCTDVCILQFEIYAYCSVSAVALNEVKE